MTRATEPQRRFERSELGFAIFLLLYAAFSLSRIPFDFRDLCYLISLEQGRWVTQEWVHPIYVPMLALLRAGLGAFGYHGRMLVPAEILNLILALTAFIALYRLARRFPGAAAPAAWILAVTALTHGFWQATVRPTPYAAAFLCQVLALSRLISDRPNTPARYAISGVFAALAMAFHASAMAFAVVACVSVLCEPGLATSDRARRALAYGGSMVLTAMACWSFFLLYNDIGLDYFKGQDFGATFRGIEQFPGTSIYSSGNLITQVFSFAETLARQVLELILLAAVLLAMLTSARGARREPFSPVERRLITVTLANLGAIAAFFLINSTRNGFIFSAFTFVPVLLAVLVVRAPTALRVLRLAAPLLMLVSLVNLATFGASGSGDPQLEEVRFLQRELGKRDVLLVPGSIFPEVLYLSHFNILELEIPGSSHPIGIVPVVRPNDTLRARIEGWIAHGSRVLLARGDDSIDFVGDPSGTAKEHQIFWRPEIVGRERTERLGELVSALDAAGLVLNPGPTSPQGQRYAEIRVRDNGSATVPPPPASASLEDLRRALRESLVDASAEGQRADYLLALQVALPEDPWIACDLMAILCSAIPRDPGKAAVGCESLPGCGVTPPTDAPPPVQPETACAWNPTTDRAAIGSYLAEWIGSHGLGDLSEWNLQLTGSSAELELILPDRKLLMRFHLASDCRITDFNSSVSPSPLLAELEQMVSTLPLGKTLVGIAPRPRLP